MTTTNQSKQWTEDIPAVSIEMMENGNLRLKDEHYSEFAVIDLHRVHVHLIAEEMGLLEKSDPDIQRQVDAAERRMEMMLDRINALHRMLETAQNDLTVLIGKPDLLALPLCHLEGTALLLEEFCHANARASQVEIQTDTKLVLPVVEQGMSLEDPRFSGQRPPNFPTNTPEIGGLQEPETKALATSTSAEQGALL